jgi:DNA-binding XRE family transcriptional regulator
MENLSIQIKDITRFQNNLKVLRSFKMLNSLELSKELNIGKKRAWDIESGRVIPNLEELSKMAEYFKVNIGDLINKEFSLSLVIK